MEKWMRVNEAYERNSNGDLRRYYPVSPGFKDSDTSKTTAEKLNKSKIRDIHEKILEVLKEPLTADEIIDDLWYAYRDNNHYSSTYPSHINYARYYHAYATYIKPRITELLRMGLITDSGERRNGFSGNPMKVWRKV